MSAPSLDATAAIRTSKQCGGVLGLIMLFACTVATGQVCEPSAQAPYTGPLYDAMAQIESTESPDKILERMRNAPVDRMALFARQHRKRNGENVVLSAARLAPEKILAGAPKAFDQRGDLDTGFVDRTLASIRANNFRFVGEIMFTHGDKTHGERTDEGERYVDPLGSGMKRLLNGLADQRIPLMTHWEVYDWERDWPRVSALYQQYPAQLFIWPHVGFADVNQVDAVLTRHTNVMATLSKKEQDQRALSDNEKAARLGPALVDGCGALKPEWRALLISHASRLMFATDAHKDFRWQKYEQVVATWRKILGQLPAEVAEAIAYRNARRVYENLP